MELKKNKGISFLLLLASPALTLFIGLVYIAYDQEKLLQNLGF